MTGKRQKPLPGFEEYLGQVSASLRFPQPRIDGYQPPNWYDIVYHPRDINFKGRLRAWINYSQLEEGFVLEEILPEFYHKLIKLYLFDDKWPNKEKVTAQIGGEPSGDLKLPLSRALIRIWRRVKNGSRAVEILRISPQDNLLYESIIAHKLSVDAKYRRIRTIDELVESSPQELSRICTNKETMEKLRGYLKPFYPKWKIGEISFPKSKV